MADFYKYFPKLLRYEGGYVDDPDDHGGPTKYGITLADWLEYGYDLTGDGKIDKEDVKLITVEQAALIAKGEYWDEIGADYIFNQSIAEVIVDWCYTSGVRTVIKRVQTLLVLEADGISGPITRYTLNTVKQDAFFEALHQARRSFYQGIVVRRPSQKKYLKGWLARTDSFKFKE